MTRKTKEEEDEEDEEAPPPNVKRMKAGGRTYPRYCITRRMRNFVPHAQKDISGEVRFVFIHTLSPPIVRVMR